MTNDKTTATTFNVTFVAGTSGEVVGPGKGRQLIVFPAPVTNRVTLSWQGAAVLDRGINLYPGDPPFQMRRQDWGSAIDQPITGISTVANEALAVTLIEAAS